jgi:hypothetical protein
MCVIIFLLSLRFQFNETNQRRTKQDSKTSIKSLTHVYLQCYNEYIKTAKLWSKQDTLDEIKWCMNWDLFLLRCLFVLLLFYFILFFYFFIYSFFFHFFFLFFFSHFFFNFFFSSFVYLFVVFFP